MLDLVEKEDRFSHDATQICISTVLLYAFIPFSIGERAGLVVRASDSRSGDPGSILGRVGVLFP